MNIAPAEYRVLYHPAANGKPFRVDVRSAGTSKWKKHSSFGNLPDAIDAFPVNGLQVDELAVKQQQHLENRAHAFDDRFGTRTRCYVCGRDKNWVRHTAGGAR